MDGGARPPNHSFRISPVDRLGRRISPSVLDAAEEVGRRAIEHAERELIDPAVAATLLEEAAATVSRALDAKTHHTQNAVRDLPSYLFLAFIRRVTGPRSASCSWRMPFRCARQVPTTQLTQRLSLS